MNIHCIPSQPAEKAAIEKATVRQVAWRTLPFPMLCYCIAHVDRVDAGFAALQMNPIRGCRRPEINQGES